MRIVAFDLSLTSTGTWDPGWQPEPVVLRPPKMDPIARLGWFESELDAMLKGADAAVVEGYSYGSPRGAGSQAHSIGELGGVFRLLCYRRAIPLAVVAPTQLKKYATGKGNATKDEVVAAIASRTGLHFPGPGANDKYDAWVLWQMACYHYEPDRAYPMPKSHTSVTQEVKWPRLEEVSRPDASTSEPIDA